MAPILRHPFIPSNLYNTCQFCTRGRGSPYHTREQSASPSPGTPSWTSLLYAFTPSNGTNLCLHCGHPSDGTWFHFISEFPPDDSKWFPDPLSDPDGELSSDADSESDEGSPPAQLLAEFEETTRILDVLREFADQAFKATADPAFTHPLQYALHLMKTGFTSLTSPPPPSLVLSDSSCVACKLKDDMISDLEDRFPTPPRVLADAASQTPHPHHLECGTQATPPLPPAPPARVLTDMGSQTPPPARPPSRLAQTPPRSESPTPFSPSTRKDFEKILARLASLRREVSPPPSPPLTPRAASPALRTPSIAGHFHLTIAIPHGLQSLTLDLVDQVPANIYTGSLKPTSPPPVASAQRGRSRGRPLASPVWGTRLSS
ncbi:hypothetical protein GSI_11356 [Ganoderma sinense ZZ0214-1]|uniref:Uncharacterized protein n=1 Tax=Ganoderma sinense ZZ0214-1 TaxID=1077348 RepID=A0A2G8RW99_9APHY|nr:hypothetical protein GSI_11356 [Ganoderma sinense ZZ0214-1]